MLTYHKFNHSDEENLMLSSQPISAGTGKPVALFSHKRKSSQELHNDRTRIRLEEQKDKSLLEARSEIMKHGRRREFADALFVN